MDERREAASMSDPGKIFAAFTVFHRTGARRIRMPHQRRHIAAAVGLALALLLVIGPRIARAHDDGYDARGERYEERRPHRYNDEYIFSTTRLVAELEVHPAFKVPLFPPAIVIDLVFLPAEVIAGLF